MTPTNHPPPGIGVRSPKWKRWVAAVVLLVAIIVLGFIAYFAEDNARHHSVGAALWSTAVVLTLVLVLLEWAASPGRRARFGFLEPIVGADGRVSTSKTVAYFWTLELAAALTLLAAVVVFTNASPSGVDTAFGTDDPWEAYFLLLGGPFASAVIAKGITISKASGDPTAKTSTNDATTAAFSTANVDETAKAKDLVTNDDGSTSLADTQYTVFSVVALAYFLGATVSNVVNYVRADAMEIALPSIPAALLGLTSLAALTYVGNKAVATLGVRVSTLLPNPATRQQQVTATVVNLPQTATSGNVVIILIPDGRQAITKAPLANGVSAATGTVAFEAPDPGSYQVVISAGSYSTPPMPLTVNS